MQTVNIIEYDNGQIKLTAFPDNEVGNQKAEDLFKELVRKEEAAGRTGCYISYDDMKAMLDDGSYDNIDRDHRILIIHSEPRE